MQHAIAYVNAFIWTYDKNLSFLPWAKRYTLLKNSFRGPLRSQLPVQQACLGGQGVGSTSPWSMRTLHPRASRAAALPSSQSSHDEPWNFSSWETLPGHRSVPSWPGGSTKAGNWWLNSGFFFKTLLLFFNLGSHQPAHPTQFFYFENQCASWSRDFSDLLIMMSPCT